MLYFLVSSEYPHFSYSKVPLHQFNVTLHRHSLKILEILEEIQKITKVAKNKAFRLSLFHGVPCTTTKRTKLCTTLV